MAAAGRRGPSAHPNQRRRAEPSGRGLPLPPAGGHHIPAPRQRPPGHPQPLGSCGGVAPCPIPSRSPPPSFSSPLPCTAALRPARPTHLSSSGCSRARGTRCAARGTRCAARGTRRPSPSRHEPPPGDRRRVAARHKMALPRNVLERGPVTRRGGAGRAQRQRPLSSPAPPALLRARWRQLHGSLRDTGWKILALKVAPV